MAMPRLWSHGEGLAIAWNWSKRHSVPITSTIMNTCRPTWASIIGRTSARHGMVRRPGEQQNASPAALTGLASATSIHVRWSGENRLPEVVTMRFQAMIGDPRFQQVPRHRVAGLVDGQGKRKHRLAATVAHQVNLPISDLAADGPLVRGV